MPAMYDALVKKGYSKGSAARITNARAKPGDPIVSPHGQGYKKKKSAAKTLYPNHA
jgi:hypothetical protein